jgi:hypothetical protein
VESALDVLPEKLEKAFQVAETLILPVALKAAGAALMSFGASAPTEDQPEESDKKVLFTRNYSQLLRKGFLDIAQSRKSAGERAAPKAASKNSKAALEERISKYSLLTDDQLETQLTAEKIGRALTNLNEFDLACLSMRMEKAVGQPFLVANNPMHPQLLSSVFQECCQKATQNDTTRKSSLNSWGKAIEVSYKDWLTEMNQTFIRMRILPNLDQTDVDNRYKHSREAERKRAETMRKNLVADVTGKPIEGDQAARPEEFSSALASLIRQKTNDSPEMQAHVVGNQTGEAIDMPALLGVLKGLQHTIQTNANTGYREQSSNQTLAELLKTDDNLSSRALDDHAQSAITLLSMMFSKLVEDDSLAAPIRPLINDLQMPVLKKALKDKEFFTDSDNSAQQLVNEIAKASSHWTPKQNASRDPFYKKLASIIDDVRDRHEESDEVFEENLDKLNDFVEREAHRSSLLEKRIIEAEEATARADSAREKVKSAIYIRSFNKKLPPMTTRFLSEQWEGVLFFYMNKEDDEESEGLSQALDNLDNLIRAASGKAVDLRSMFEAMNRQMVEIGLARGDREQILKDLLAELKQMRILAARAENQKLQAAATPVKPVSLAVPLPVAMSAATDIPSILETQEVAVSDTNATHAIQELTLDDDVETPVAPVVISITPAAQTDSEVEHFVTPAISPTLPPVEMPVAETEDKEDDPALESLREYLPDPQTEDEDTDQLEDEKETPPMPSPDAAAPDSDDEFLKKAGEIRVGDWLHWMPEGEEERAKIKLAAIIRHNGTYVFVNREGVKALVTQKQGVADQLRTGSISLIEDGIFFDRALRSVISNLKE